MEGRVQKWGNSLALRIPKAIAIEAGLQPNSAIEIRVLEGKIIVEALPAPMYNLDELLARVTNENLHGEVDTGERVGNEAW